MAAHRGQVLDMRRGQIFHGGDIGRDVKHGKVANMAVARGTFVLAGMGGIMGVGSRLMSAGLNMGEIKGVTRELIAYARDKAGDDDVNALVDAIPGLSQFI